MEHFIKLITLAVLVNLGNCGEAPYPAEINSINDYSNPTPAIHSTYNPKWQPEHPQVPPIDPEAFSVQSGYEGYLIPSEPPFSILDLLKTAGIVSLIPPLSKIGLKLIVKLGIWALGFGALFLVGTVFTSIVCTFTPLCTISFLGMRGFNTESVRSLISQDKINNATKFVANAIKKYRELNNEIKEKKDKKV